jgi:tetratricopeptide (TPR) repeat protein
MAQLSTLFLILALSAYLWGRLRIAENETGLPWLLATIPLAGIGFLGKENVVLLPLLLLACELTLLRQVSPGRNPWPVRAVWLVLIALPLIAGTIYLLNHPGLLNHDGRPFTFEERILTQPRILWLYLNWLFIPDISQLGLFHDDVIKSTSLLSPPTTLIAIAAWVGVAAPALVMSKRWPVFSFAVLFFLAAHALESTIFPLEMVFEHRNYLASVGPLFLLAYLVTVAGQRTRFPRAIAALGLALVAVYAAATSARVQNWTSHETFVLASAQNHPGSARAQFMAGQLAIAMLPQIQGDKAEIANVAEQFLEQGLKANDRCLNCLFGLLVLDLHLERAPEQGNLDDLVRGLRSGPVDASIVSVSQFNYLVEWAKGGESTLTGDIMKSLFDAALENPGWNYTGRAGIESTYREYLELVVGDLELALEHARAAVALWPSQWSYHKQLISLLLKMGREDEALSAVQVASKVAVNAQQQIAIEQFESILRRPGPE